MSLSTKDEAGRLKPEYLQGNIAFIQAYFPCLPYVSFSLRLPSFGCPSHLYSIRDRSLY